ncbi:MAG: hypothetical protein WCB94_08825 [Terriglobales bacterium]
MEISKLNLLGGYFRAYSSEAYKDTLRTVEHLASTSLLLLERKSEAEKRDILAKAQALTEKLSDTVANESPLVGVLALLTAVRVHERLIQEQANKHST